MIPLSVPEISGNEWKYVKECLDTGWVSSVGSYVERFEQTIREYSGAPFAVAVATGTAALKLSLLASGVGKEDEVIVPTLTFIATVNAVSYVGAHPVFMDSTADTLCLDVQKLESFFVQECILKKDGTYNKTTQRKIKAVIPVHIFGHPVDMDPLLSLARKYQITVIEDAAESIGSLYKERKTGALGDIGCYSFNGNKILTTGGGGMVITHNEAVAKRVKHLSTQAKCDAIEYDHDEIGFNDRLTNIQAALGVAQLERLEDFIKIKRANADAYKGLLAEIPSIEFLGEKPWARSNCWFYTIRMGKEDKAGLLRHLLANGIQARPVWKLIHSLPMYRQAQAFKIETATNAYETCLNIPCSVNLRQEDIRKVVDEIKAYFSLRSVR